MKISHLKTNHIENPLAYALDKPTFSWIVEDSSDKKQSAAQVLISRDVNFQQLVFDSGKVAGMGIDGVSYRPSISLEACTRYFWKVRIWGETESAESEVAWFETGKLDTAWQAQWISPTWDDKQVHPILFREFSLPAEIASARIYICGLGLYHLELNGRKVGNEYFTPYCNAYDQWLQYQTFDIGSMLQVGTNLITVMLGNGWYKGRYGADGGKSDFYGQDFALLCEVHIRLKNGETLVISTDENWKAQPAPVLASSIFDGETYDARIEKSPAVREAFAVKCIDINTKSLEARRSVPVYIQEEIKPIALIHTPAGETVLDMGQNMTGWLRFRTTAPSGTSIRLEFGEVLQNGNFFRDNLRTAKAEYIYIADGSAAVAEPYFSFFGFRYVKISGWQGELNLDDFTGCVLYSQMDSIGSLETSNAKVNQLIKNILWGQKGNFLDIPTDCPQRDERLGWTGDIQVFSGAACFNMDTAAFLSKYLYDLAKEQSKLNGMVPHIVPMVNLNKGGSSAWGDAATIVPWNLYEFFGDTAILVQQFESMRAWVDYIRGIDEASGAKRLWTEGFHFGDWLALDAEDPTSRKGGTPEDFIASAFYAYSAQIVAQAARVLGKEQAALFYGQLASAVKNAIQSEYFTATGRLAIPTQTAYVLTLFMDLAPNEHYERVKADFIAKLQRDKIHLRTGFVGTPYLCRVLSKIGANDLAYQLLMNEDYPSWLYAVNLGATTIWERWNSLNPDGSISSTSMNSLNHYAYGSILEWMYRDMLGLNPALDAEKSSGFRHARIAPKPHPSLQWAKARYRSPLGYYEIAWHFDDTQQICLEISIPFNAEATLVLADTEMHSVRMNGAPVQAAEKVAHNLELTLSAGHYRMEYPSQY